MTGSGRCTNGSGLDRDADARHTILLHHAPVTLWSVDRNLRLTCVEGRGVEIPSTASRDLVGTTIPELLGTSDRRDPVLQAYHRALEGEPAQLDIEWEGRIWEVRLQPCLEGDEVRAVVGAGHDVTRRRAVERRLQEDASHFQRLFEESPEAIVIVNEEDRVLQINPEFERLFGYTSDEAVGQLVNDLLIVPGQESEATELTRRVASGERIEVEAVRRHKDGSPIEVSILATPVQVSGERRVYGIYRDITEQKSLELQLLHSQRLEAVGQLAGGVAHDFNNILTAILGQTQMLLQELGNGGERFRADIEQIEAAARRAARLTNQLLTFGRRDRVSAQSIDLTTLVRATRNLLERLIEERVDLRFQLAEGLPPIQADPGQVEQIVMNLVINARDASEQGGVVTVVTGRAPDRGNGREEEARAFLEVRDEGRGMTDEERVRMFEPFFTTKPRGKGAGLGLSTVYGIAERAGGEIEVDTAPGAGTTIRVCFPSTVPTEAGSPEAARPSSASGSESSTSGSESSAPASNEDPPGRAELVLLVDDDRSVRDVVRRILERANFQVVATDSAEAALEYCDSARPVPDVVVSDIVMPGMSGYDLVEHIQRHFPDVPALLMTGYADPAESPKDEQAEILRKPFDAQTLVRRLRERLAESRARSPRPSRPSSGHEIP